MGRKLRLCAAILRGHTVIYRARIEGTVVLGRAPGTHVVECEIRGAKPAGQLQTALALNKWTLDNYFNLTGDRR